MKDKNSHKQSETFYQHSAFDDLLPESFSSGCIYESIYRPFGKKKINISCLVKNWCSFMITLVFVGLIGWYTVLNYPVISKTIIGFAEHRVSIRDLKINLTEALESDKLLHKDEFINLNGLYGKLSGRRLYNGIILMKNGMLTEDLVTLSLDPVQISQKMNALTDFDSFVSDRGGNFVYVQFPRKFDMENELLPQGRGSHIAKETESLVQTFRNAGIDVIDMLPILSKSQKDIENNFYRTDHHWKPSAAFKTFQTIMEHLTFIYPEETFNSEIMRLDNWTVKEIPNQFLGSLGKRVGWYFAGVDSLEWMTPDFETKISFYNPRYHTFLKGDFSKAFIRNKYMKTGSDKMHENHYCVYIGGDYPLTQSRNLNASSDKKLLIIKDSYDLPLLAFLSLVFREVDVIDPRYYTAGSVMEYIDRTHPDIVLMAINPTALVHKSYFVFTGESDLMLADGKRALTDESVRIDQNNGKKHRIIYHEGFENEMLYSLSLPKIIVTDGETDAITIALYDPDRKKIVQETMFDIEYCNKYGDCEWIFETPETGSRHLQLLIYAGIRGKTNGVGLSVEHATLWKREILSD